MMSRRRWGAAQAVTPWRAIARCTVAAALVALGVAAWAGGTPAGRLIGNTAVVNYTSYGTTYQATASAPQFAVAQLLSVALTWQDASPAAVKTPDTLRPLAFRVTNTGNGIDTFVLARDNAVGGNAFNPIDSPQGAIWLESGARPGLQTSGPNADVVYAPGSNDITLAPDASQVVYLSSSIPAGLATGAAAQAALLARSISAPPGSVAGQQVGVQSGVALIAGPGRARSAANGSYLVSTVSVGMTKAVTSVVDGRGGTQVMSGAVLTYRLTVTVSGSGTANNLVVTDPLPPQLTYLPGSLTVDGVPRTDVADGDDSSFTNGTVRTVLSAVAAPQVRVIEFKATVN